MNAIEIETLCKAFHSYHGFGRSRLMDRLRGIRSEPASKDLFWALKNVSLDIPVGQRVAIIGANGSGKTTLLRILARIISPTSGVIRLRGRTVSIIDIGSGFHPDLTGRENTILNGVIIGMTKEEIRCKFDKIHEFSGIGDFIDTPVKYYSSGMYLRLAFSIAAHAEADNMLLDEVVAVGDSNFQKQCRSRLRELSNEGRTLVLVSHDLVAIRELATLTVLMKHGEIVDQDMDSEKMIKKMLDINNSVSTCDI